MQPDKNPFCGPVLIIAGTDSSGGAGLSRDIQTITAHGLRSCPVVTTVTAQTDNGVIASHVIPAGLVHEQIKTAATTHNISAVKIGLLATPKIVQITAAALLEYLPLTIPVVLDPVLISSSGKQLLDPDGRAMLKLKLLPRCDLLTPNLPEAATLTGQPLATSKQNIARQAKTLQDMGARNVLIKGGHAKDHQATDTLLEENGTLHQFTSPRLPGTARGTGCTLASTITAHLANRHSIKSACQAGKRFVAEMFEQFAIRPQ